MIQTINFISRREAECEQPSLFSDVLVSIGESGQPLPNLENGWRDVLSLQFWDMAGRANGLVIQRVNSALGLSGY